MATRQETWRHREALKRALREACDLRRLPPGAPVPPVRDLAAEYQLSGNVVCQVLQELVAEGALHTVPRVGTFVGAPVAPAVEFYLMLLPDHERLTNPLHLAQIQAGFETRIAELGGASLALPLGRAVELRVHQALPPLEGLFDFAYHRDETARWGPAGELPRVAMRGRVEDEARSDLVSYDDLAGGRQAAQHLLQVGHRRVAFLALHPAAGEAGQLVWSQERELGWREALRTAGLDAKGLAFHPRSAPEQHFTQHLQAGRDLAGELHRHPDITAVVAANDFAALGLLEGMRQRGLAPAQWPAVVGFDNLPNANGYVLSSLRLPGETLGRAAAELLWERRHGRLTGAPHHRRVAIHLIPRLTSRPDWSRAGDTAALVAPGR
jgi:DNA-binding LacI/PurR family transcriptional regulator